MNINTNLAMETETNVKRHRTVHLSTHINNICECKHGLNKQTKAQIQMKLLKGHIEECVSVYLYRSTDFVHLYAHICTHNVQYNYVHLSIDLSIYLSIYREGPKILVKARHTYYTYI